MSKTPASASDNNPLLSRPDLPHGAYPLDSVKPEHFLPAFRAAIVEARAELEKIRDNPQAPDFENTIHALEFLGNRKDFVSSVYGNINSANSNEELRGIESEMNAEGIRFANDLLMDEKLFARVKKVYEDRDRLPLDWRQKKLLQETYKSFTRSGANLDAAGKKRLREINEKLAELGTDYKNNSLLAVAAYKKVIDSEDDLKGIPQRAKDAYRAEAEKEGLKGKWLLRLSPPPVDIFEYAENRALREEIHRAWTGVAWQPPVGRLRAIFNRAVDFVLRRKPKPNNAPVILQTVKLRQERAELLGYKNHADFVLDDRMAKTEKTVMDFLDKNQSVYYPAAEAYLQKIRGYAAKEGVADIQPWDVAYYGRRLKEETFNLSLESLRPYFRLENVLDGARQHVEKLFNIKMTETQGKYPVYHPDVKVYEVTDKATGEMIGLFYADYFARPGAKRGGAWMNVFRNRGLEHGENKFAFVVNVCNFQKPAEGKPSLLSLDDVRTVFHELGHGLHALLAKGDYPSLTGTNVKWDFVEVPSQLQENWARTKEVLDTFARHFETGDPLSAEMIQKINAMGNFTAGYQGLRQTYLARLDMTWHTTDPATIKSVESLEDKVNAETWLFPRAGGTLSTNFGHIFAGGYAAGYYSYKWAEVQEADIFEVFDQNGLYHEEKSAKLRELYESGGMVEPDILFRNMMNRDPDPQALHRREGLLPKIMPAERPRPPQPGA